jgi:hypothetical protein
MEAWERLSGKDRKYEVSDHGRVREYRTGALVSLDATSVRMGRPAVQIRGEMRYIKGLVARTFGNEFTEVASAAALGEEAVLLRRRALEEEMEQLDAVLLAMRTRCLKEHGVREPEARTTMREVALEEARYLGAVYRSGVTRDPVSGLLAGEVEGRLRRLKGIYGDAVAAASGVALWSSGDQSMASLHIQ